MVILLMVTADLLCVRSRLAGPVVGETKPTQALVPKNEAMESELMQLETMKTLITVMDEVAHALLNWDGSEGMRCPLFDGKYLSQQS